MPEGEEEEQEIGNLFANIMKKNFPNLAKEIDFQEAQRVPKKLDPRRNTPRHIIITLPEIKQKQQEKRTQLPTKEFPLDNQLISQKKPCRQEGAAKKYLKS